MIVVVVGYNNGINCRDIFNLAGYLCVSLGTKPAERTASFRKDWIEQNTQAPGEFYEVASMAQPCGPKIRSIS